MTENKQTVWLELYGYAEDADFRNPERRYRCTRSQNILTPIVGDVVTPGEAQALIDTGITVNIGGVS